MSDHDPNASIFERRPSEHSPPPSYRIWRVGTKAKGGAIILSSDTIGCYTHWWGGRTRACSGDGCEPCKNNCSRRWHSYFIAWSPKSNEKLIVEIPQTAAQTFWDWFDEHRTLRGYRFELERRGNKVNGKVISTIFPGKMEDHMIPACPALEPMLLRMWETHTGARPDHQAERPRIADFPDQEQAG